jgi:lysophospholipase L1-like esterase
MERAPSVRSRLLVGLCGLAVALVAAEAVARWAGGRAAVRSLHELRPGEPWLYGLRPGATARHGLWGPVYRINGHGFRDDQWTVEKAPSSFRIAVLGDSIAFGYGVPEEARFTERMEVALQETMPDLRVEVLNFGVNGYNPYNEAELLRVVVLRFAPDLVLVQFCLNDLNDPTLHFDSSTVQRLGELPALAFPNPEARRPPPPPLSPLARTCHAMRLCGLFLERAWVQARGPRDAQDWRATLEARDGPEFAVEWNWLRDRYRDMGVATAGVRFGVVVFPYEAQLQTGGDEGALAQPALARLGDQGGWVVIDLLAAFRAARRPDMPHFLDFWHPTAAGHAVAGEAIARHLSCRGLLPGPRNPACD